jgi:hypothetical protein
MATCAKRVVVCMQAQESLESPQDDDGLTGLTLPAVTADTDHPEPDASEQCLFAELVCPHMVPLLQHVAVVATLALTACFVGSPSAVVYLLADGCHVTLSLL